MTEFLICAQTLEITGNPFVTPQEDCTRHRRRGAVRIAGGSIAEVGEADALRAAHPALPVEDLGDLLLIPGFVTDIIGFACLVPPLRRSIALWALQHVIVPPPPPGGPGPTSGDKGPRVIEGDYRREDD